jgi:hypothetical protein
MMKNLGRPLAILGMITIIPSLVCGSDKALVEFRGEYLAYSYDHNQIYGYAVEFALAGYDVRSRYLKIDLSARSFYAFGSVALKKDSEVLTGDELIFDPENGRGTLLAFGETIESRLVGSGSQTELAKPVAADDVTLKKIKGSLIYSTCRRIELTEEFEVIGYEVTFFIEGAEALSFSRFKLSAGLQMKKAGLSLDKVWYTRYQGIFGRASYSYEQKDRLNSLTQVQYEERSILKNYIGPKRLLDVMTSTTFRWGEKTDLGILGNYNSSGLWNADIWLKESWSDSVQTAFDFSYDKPVRYRGEAWLGAQSTVSSKNWGNLSILGRYEIHNQVLGSLAYNVSILKNLHFLANTSYSRLTTGGSEEYSEIFLGNVRIAHNSRLFNLATDYYLNYDVIGKRAFSQPQLDIGLNPFFFYGDLLSLSVRNLFLYNVLSGSPSSSSVYSNNTVFSLMTRELDFQRGFSLSARLAVEQFFEKDGRNFTSGGIILNARKSLFGETYLETYYSVQSRRRSKSWLIEGTTSQDLSLMLRSSLAERVDGWISVSYDPEDRRWRQSFAELTLRITRKWRLHSLLDYDHLLKRINNVDLYLVRQAGRFQLRFIWRSLTKQFLVELVPG